MHDVVISLLVINWSKACIYWDILLHVQGARKKYPPKIVDNISPTTEILKIKCCTPIWCSYLSKITKFYLFNYL